jgi:prefoldin alpha subunit
VRKMAEKNQVKLTGQQVLQAYQIEQAKLESVRNRLEQLQRLLSETIGAEQTIGEVAAAKKDQKIMVSVGAGVYAEARLESVKEVKTGLGGGVLVSSTTEKTLKELGKRKEEIRKDLNAARQEEILVMQNLNNLGLAIESARKKKAGEAAETRKVS